MSSKQARSPPSDGGGAEQGSLSTLGRGWPPRCEIGHGAAVRKRTAAVRCRTGRDRAHGRKPLKAGGFRPWTNGTAVAPLAAGGHGGPTPRSHVREAAEAPPDRAAGGRLVGQLRRVRLGSRPHPAHPESRPHPHRAGGPWPHRGRDHGHGHGPARGGAGALQPGGRAGAAHPAPRGHGSGRGGRPGGARPLPRASRPAWAWRAGSSPWRASAR